MGLESLTGKAIDAISLGGNGLSFTDLPPEIISKITGLVTILKTAGIIFIVYIVFLILRWIFTLKRYRLTKKMNKKINEIDRKLDLLIKEREGISKLKIQRHQEKEKIGKEPNLKEIKRKTKEIKKKLKKEKRKKKKH